MIRKVRKDKGTRRRPYTYRKRGPHGLLKAERNQQIMHRLRIDQMDMATVAREFGVTRERVRQIAKVYYGETARSLGIIERMGDGKRARKQATAEHKVERERKKAERRAFIEEIVTDMVKLQDLGVKQADIAFVFGCSQSYVSSLLVSAGHRSYPKRRGINVIVD